MSGPSQPLVNFFFAVIFWTFQLYLLFCCKGARVQTNKASRGEWPVRLVVGDYGAMSFRPEVRSECDDKKSSFFRLTIVHHSVPIGHTKSSQIPLSPPSLLTRPRARSLHITPPLLESKTKRLARLKKKAVIQQRSQKVAELEATKPDPVLGYGPGREFVWENSELKRLLLGKEEVWAGKAGSETPEGGEGNGTSSSNEASLENPTRPPLLNFGITPSTSSLLFSALPSVSAQRISTMQGTYEAAIEKKQAEVEEEEVNKRERLMRILDLRNADSKGIRLENQRRIVRAFGRPGVGVGEEMEDEKQGDTGREEVRGRSFSLPHPIRGRHGHSI